jgi:hypothetical protein
MEIDISQGSLSPISPTHQYLIAESPRCETCCYVLPSYTASTGLRCGLEYSRANAIVKKLRPMDFYPTVKPSNACELWLAQDPLN